MTAARRVSRPVQHVTWSRCPRCRMVVLDVDTTESLPSFSTSTRHVDPTPISLPEETACVLTGRPTWAWAWRFATHLLDLRSELYWANHDQETSTTRPTVLPEHRCGGRFPSSLPAAATARPSPPPADPPKTPDLLDLLEPARKEDQCPF